MQRSQPQVFIPPTSPSGGSAAFSNHVDPIRVRCDGEGFYGEIPGFQGVFAQGDTLKTCRTELTSTLEDWLLFRITRQHAIPAVNGIDPTIREVEAAA